MFTVDVDNNGMFHIPKNSFNANTDDRVRYFSTLCQLRTNHMRDDVPQWEWPTDRLHKDAPTCFTCIILNNLKIHL